MNRFCCHNYHLSILLNIIDIYRNKVFNGRVILISSGPFMFKEECQIHIDKLKTFIWSIMWKLTFFCMQGYPQMFVFVCRVSNKCLFLYAGLPTNVCFCMQGFQQMFVFVCRVTHKCWDFRDDCTDFIKPFPYILGFMQF